MQQGARARGAAWPSSADRGATRAANASGALAGGAGHGATRPPAAPSCGAPPLRPTARRADSSAQRGRRQAYVPCTACCASRRRAASPGWPRAARWPSHARGCSFLARSRRGERHTRRTRRSAAAAPRQRQRQRQRPQQAPRRRRRDAAHAPPPPPDPHRNAAAWRPRRAPTLAATVNAPPWAQSEGRPVIKMASLSQRAASPTC